MDGWVDVCKHAFMYVCIHTHTHTYTLLSTEENSFDLGSGGDGGIS